MRGPAHQILDELSRRIAGMVRIGLISEVDYAQTRIRVQSGQIETGWLPWPASMGRNYVGWRPLAVGQEVILLSPSGDLSQAVVVGLLHVESDPPPSTDETLDIVRFRSGTTVQHDADTGDLLITAARHVTINVAGDATINATGNVDIDGARIDLN